MHLARLILASTSTQLMLGRAKAANVNVTNSTEPAKQTTAFNRKSDHEAVLSCGLSGQFVSQITPGTTLLGASLGRRLPLGSR